MHGLEAEYGENINFVYLDIDDPLTSDFKRGLGYRYQPHLFLVDEDGNIIEQWLGQITREDLERAFGVVLE